MIFDIPIFKVALVLTNYAIVAFLGVLMVDHYKSNFNLLSFSNIFHMLSFVSLSIRGLFWTLTIISFSEWTAFTFYTLYWLPSPFQFCSFLLLPLFCVKVMYPRQFTDYWGRIRIAYITVVMGLILFQVMWALLSALERQSKTELGCDTDEPGESCYHTAYSSDAFRAVTGLCFISLAIIQGAYGYVVFFLDKKTHERLLTSSPHMLAVINIILFVSFLSRGCYQIEAIFYDDTIHNMNIPLQGSSDINWTIFISFELWEYIPTILLVLTLTTKTIGTTSHKLSSSSFKKLQSEVDRINDRINVDYPDYDEGFTRIMDKNFDFRTPLSRENSSVSSSLETVNHSFRMDKSSRVKSIFLSERDAESSPILQRFEAPLSLTPASTWLNDLGNLYDDSNRYMRGTPESANSQQDRGNLLQYYKQFRGREGSIGNAGTTNVYGDENIKRKERRGSWDFASTAGGRENTRDKSYTKRVRSFISPRNGSGTSDPNRTDTGYLDIRRSNNVVEMCTQESRMAGLGLAAGGERDSKSVPVSVNSPDFSRRILAEAAASSIAPPKSAHIHFDVNGYYQSSCQVEPANPSPNHLTDNANNDKKGYHFPASNYNTVALHAQYSERPCGSRPTPGHILSVSPNQRTPGLITAIPRPTRSTFLSVETNLSPSIVTGIAHDRSSTNKSARGREIRRRESDFLLEGEP